MEYLSVEKGSEGCTFLKRNKTKKSEVYIGKLVHLKENKAPTKEMSTEAMAWIENSFN